MEHLDGRGGTAVYTAASIVSAQITAPTKASTWTGAETAPPLPGQRGSGATSDGISGRQRRPGGEAASPPSATSNLTLTIAGSADEWAARFTLALYGYSGGIWSVRTRPPTCCQSGADHLTGQGINPSWDTRTFTWTAENVATSYQRWVLHGGGRTRPGGSGNLEPDGYGGRSAYQWQHHHVTVIRLCGVVPGRAEDRSPTRERTGCQCTDHQLRRTDRRCPVIRSRLPGRRNREPLPISCGWEAHWSSLDLGVGGTEGLAVTISNLPTNGSQVFATLYGYSGGVWSVQDTATYLAAGGGPP